MCEMSWTLEDQVNCLHKRDSALAYFMSLNEKKTWEVKGRSCAEGMISHDNEQVLSDDITELEKNMQKRHHCLFVVVETQLFGHDYTKVSAVQVTLLD